MPVRGQTNDTPVAGRTRSVAVSVLAGIIVCAVLLLLMSIVLATQNIPQSAIDPMAAAALCAGAFASGYMCAKATGKNGLIYGAICGGVFTCIVLTAGLITGGNGVGIPALFKMAFIMLSSMIGGVVRVNKRRRR